MKLTVYNRENSRPAEVNYQGKRTINLNRTGAIYLSKTLSVEMGIAGGEGVNFAMMKKRAAGTFAARRTKAASPYGRTSGARDSQAGSWPAN